MALPKWEDLNPSKKYLDRLDSNNFRCTGIIEDMAWLKAKIGAMETFPGMTDIERQVQEVLNHANETWEAFVILKARWERYRILSEKLEDLEDADVQSAD